MDGSCGSSDCNCVSYHGQICAVKEYFRGKLSNRPFLLCFSIETAVLKAVHYIWTCTNPLAKDLDLWKGGDASRIWTPGVAVIISHPFVMLPPNTVVQNNSFISFSRLPHNSKPQHVYKGANFRKNRPQFLHWNCEASSPCGKFDDINHYLKGCVRSRSLPSRLKLSIADV